MPTEAAILLFLQRFCKSQDVGVADDFSFFHADDAIDKTRQIHGVVIDEDHRESELSAKIPDQFDALGLVRFIEVCERFVEQEQVRFADQRFSDGDPLLFAFRKKGRSEIDFFRHFQSDQHLFDAKIDFRFA